MCDDGSLVADAGLLLAGTVMDRLCWAARRARARAARARSTAGTFLRSFTFGHLARWAARVVSGAPTPRARWRRRCWWAAAASTTPTGCGRARRVRCCPLGWWRRRLTVAATIRNRLLTVPGRLVNHSGRGTDCACRSTGPGRRHLHHREPATNPQPAPTHLSRPQRPAQRSRTPPATNPHQPHTPILHAPKRAGPHTRTSPAATRPQPPIPQARRWIQAKRAGGGGSLPPLTRAHGDDPPRWQRGAGACVLRPCLRVAETAATRSATTPTRRGLGRCGGCAARADAASPLAKRCRRADAPGQGVFVGLMSGTSKVRRWRIMARLGTPWHGLIECVARVVPET